MARGTGYVRAYRILTESVVSSQQRFRGSGSPLRVRAGSVSSDRRKTASSRKPGWHASLSCLGESSFAGGLESTRISTPLGLDWCSALPRLACGWHRASTPVNERVVGQACNPSEEEIRVVSSLPSEHAPWL